MSDVNTENPVFAMFSIIVCFILSFMYYKLMTGDPGKIMDVHVNHFAIFISRRALAREGHYEMMSVCACVCECVRACVR